METLYEKASLILNPGVYDSGKVYATKPFDGSGDLTFTRASNATRVASNGLIEKVRTNLLLQSNTFSTTWVKSVATVTGGQTGYDGSTNAWLLEKSGSFGRVEQAITMSGFYAFSVYAKAGTSSFLAMGANGSIVTSGAYFDLDNGVVGSKGSAVVFSSMQSVGNGWYRCVAILNNPTENFFRIYPSATDGGASDTSGNILIQNAQLEAGDIATDYIATTSAAVSVGPVSGLPRLDYLNSSCPRLLLEPQTTALNQFSESFDDSYWQLKTDVTISANTTDTLDPSGYYGADKLTETATTARHRVASNFANLTTTNHTASVFMKKGTARYGFVTFASSTVNTVIVDLEDGTITATSTSGTIVTQKVENYGNGWYRISVTALSAISGSTQYSLQFGSAGSAVPSSYIGNIPSFAGSTSNYLYAWGANLTATSYLQSYIPTLSTSVTRVADAARTASGATSLFNSTWTAFGELIIPAKGTSGTATGFGLRNTYGGVNPTDFVYNTVHSSSANSLDFLWYVGGVTTKTVTVAITYGTPVKFAVTSDGILYVNGVQVSASSSLTPATPVELAFGRLGQVDASNGEAESVAQALLFKSILTPAQLAELTA